MKTFIIALSFAIVAVSSLLFWGINAFLGILIVFVVAPVFLFAIYTLAKMGIMGITQRKVPNRYIKRGGLTRGNNAVLIGVFSLIVAFVLTLLAINGAWNIIHILYKF